MASAPVRLMIAVPTYGGLTPEHVTSVLKLQAWLQARGVPVQTVQHGMTEIARSRNILAAIFLEAADATHLLFIDSDMSFPSTVTMKLLAADKAVIGATAPQRHVSMDRLIALARANPTATTAKVFGSALTYNIRRADRQFRFEDGVAEVEGIGMAATLIDISVLKRMIEAGVAKPLARSVGAHPAFGFFDPVVGDDGSPLSEDLSFCTRWRSIGGKVHAIDSATVGHVGNFTYEGSFVESLGAP